MTLMPRLYSQEPDTPMRPRDDSEKSHRNNEPGFARSPCQGSSITENQPLHSSIPSSSPIKHIKLIRRPTRNHFHLIKEPLPRVPSHSDAIFEHVIRDAEIALDVAENLDAGGH